MKLPKLVLTDIDGVWTDGGMYYSEDGNEWKKFNTSDSAGIIFLRVLNIPVGIITGENTNIVRNRAKKLKIDMLYMGVQNKLSVVEDIAKELNIELGDIAYLGDDINDIFVLQSVGFSAVPNGVAPYVAKHADIMLKKKGGEGVFREFVEYILSESGQMDHVLNKLNF